MSIQIQFEAWMIYERERPLGKYQVEITNTLASKSEIFTWMVSVSRDEEGWLVDFGFRAIEVEVENSNVNS